MYNLEMQHFDRETLCCTQSQINSTVTPSMVFVNKNQHGPLEIDNDRKLSAMTVFPIEWKAPSVSHFQSPCKNII